MHNLNPKHVHIFFDAQENQLNEIEKDPMPTAQPPKTKI
jgi:hypothetical protein